LGSGEFNIKVLALVRAILLCCPMEEGGQVKEQERTREQEGTESNLLTSLLQS
jgi:hypothetical protein